MNNQNIEEKPLELSQDEKAYAGLAHALMISTWWIGPLIIYFVRKESQFVRFHALQALFWQIIHTLLYLGTMFVFFFVMFATVLSMPQGKAAEPGQFPVAIFVMFPILWLVMMSGLVISMTLGILYCLKAMRGEWAAYPIIGQWVHRILGA